MRYMKNLLKYFLKTKRTLKNKKVLSGNFAGKKIHTSSAATLTIDCGARKKEKVNEEKIEKIIEKFINTPEKLFEYIKGAGTNVYKIKNADKILSFIKEQEGFILPQSGLKALYLNLILNKKISFKTSEMFVLRSFRVNSCAVTYQFYNWYCYKMKLEGYETKTQKKFKHVFEICETNKIDEMSFEEILELKSAIKRDIEAINFVKKFVIKTSMAKENLAKIKNGQAIKV